MNSIKRIQTDSTHTTSSISMSSSTNATQPITYTNTLPTSAIPTNKEGYLELIL